MSNSVRREKRQFALNVIIIVIVAVVTMAIVWVLSASKETITINRSEENTSDAITCIGHTDNDSFFKNSFEKTITQEIKILLKNKRMDSLSLKYVSVLSSVNNAEQMGGILHANYNEYFAKYNMKPTLFTPDFTVDDKTVTITLFGNVDNINTYTSSLFSINASDYYKVKSFSMAELKKYYENKGFSCNYQE